MTAYEVRISVCSSDVCASVLHVAIIEHPDVRRTLMLMRSLTEACRGLIYLNAAAIDRALHHPDEAERQRWKAMVELFTPLSKAWATDIGCEEIGRAHV